MVSFSVALSLRGVPSLQQLLIGLQQPACHFLCLLIGRGLMMENTTTFTTNMSSRGRTESVTDCDSLCSQSIRKIIWLVVHQITSEQRTANTKYIGIDECIMCLLE